MAFTTIEIDEFLTDLKAAYKAVITGKSYTINTGGTSRSLTRADAPWIRDEMFFWDKQKAQATSGRKGIPTKFGTVWRERERD